jgi:hypothetical protein
LLIGIDFDNTIANYDEVFAAVAEHEALLAPSTATTKSEVKAAVLALQESERGWMRLQGRVYGAHMHRATIFDGVADFLRECKGRGIEVSIVSHKTMFGHFDPDQVNLRDAARTWMTNQGFFGSDKFGIDPKNVFFESTREEKVARIDTLKCDHFIDDLVEVLDHPGFPARTQAHLFAPRADAAIIGGFRAHGDWSSIRECLIDDS